MRVLVCRLVRGEAGSVLSEVTLVFPIFVFLTVGVFEISVLFWRLNTVDHALMVGSRILAASAPVAPDFNAGLADFLETGSGSATCGGADETVCDADAVSSLRTGSDADCQSVSGSILGLCDMLPDLATDNIQITYRFLSATPDGDRVQVMVALDFVDYSISLPVLQSLADGMSVTVSVPPGLAVMSYRSE